LTITSDPSGTPGDANDNCGGEGCVPMLALLLQAGADPNQRFEDGRTPLMYAAGSGYTTAVAAVLGAGGRVDAADSLGWTALHVACATDSGAAASDENKTDTNGHTHDDTCGHDHGAGQSGGVGHGRYCSKRRRKPYNSIMEGS